MTIYRDLNLDFIAHPNTGDIVKTTNADAIKRSFRNLVNTNVNELPFMPTLGSSIRGSLFENFSPLNIEFFKKKIRELAEEWEPRVQIITVDVVQQEDYNSLQVSIQYRIIEINRIENITIFVGRTR